MGRGSVVTTISARVGRCRPSRAGTPCPPRDRANNEPEATVEHTAHHQQPSCHGPADARATHRGDHDGAARESLRVVRAVTFLARGVLGRPVMILWRNREARGARWRFTVVVSATLACGACGDESTLVAQDASAQNDAAASVDSACSGKSCAYHDGSAPDVTTDEPCPSPPILPQGTSCPAPGTACKAGLGDDPSLFELCTCMGPSSGATWQCQEVASPADASLADAGRVDAAVAGDASIGDAASGDVNNETCPREDPLGTSCTFAAASVTCSYGPSMIAPCGEVDSCECASGQGGPPTCSWGSLPIACADAGDGGH